MMPVETQNFASPIVRHYQNTVLEMQDFASLLVILACEGLW